MRRLPILRIFLLVKCTEELKPAKDRGFKLGYFGPRGVKYNVQTREQLREAYETAKKGWMTLWASPHSAFDMKHSNQKFTETSKESTDEPSAKKQHLDQSPDKETTEEAFKRLKAKHASQYNDFKLKCWAQMLVKGNHSSEDYPPQKPFFLGRGKSSTTASSTTTSSSESSVRSLSNSLNMKMQTRGKILDQLEGPQGPERFRRYQ